MSRILTRVTRGRIVVDTTKTVLVLAVAGSLYFAPQIEPPIVNNGGGIASYYDNSIAKKQENEARLRKINIEDSEVIAIVQVCLKTIYI